MNILYADDDPLACRLVQNGLRGTSHKLWIASSVASAIPIVCNDPIDVLVTSLVIYETPALNLAVFTRMLTDSIFIVALTSHTLPSEQSLIGTNCDAVLTKPISIEQLLEALLGWEHQFPNTPQSTDPLPASL